VWSPRLQKALDRALAPEPEDRYATVSELAREVRGAAGMSVSVGVVAPTDAATQMVTPLMMPAVPEKAGQKPGAKGSRKGALIVCALLLMAASTLVAMNPPRSLDAFLRKNGVALSPAPKDAAGRSADSSGAGSVALADSAAHAAAAGSSGRDSLSPIDAGLRLQSAAMHAGMRGDSGVGAAPVMQTADLDAREIMVHVNRARELVRVMQLKGAGLELRTSYEEYRIFLTEHASAPQTESLRKELQGAMDEALNTCYAARDSAVVKGTHPFRCEHPAKTGILVVEDEEPPRSP
jgi:hypothetical protein